MVAARRNGLSRPRSWALSLVACAALTGCASGPITWFEKWMADDQLKVASKTNRGEITTAPFLLKPTAPELGIYGPFVRVRGFWDSNIPKSVALDLSVQYGGFGGYGFTRSTRAQVIADGQRFDLTSSDSKGYRPASLQDGGAAFFFTRTEFELLLRAHNIAIRVSDANASVIGILKENDVFYGKGDSLISVLESARRSHLAQDANEVVVSGQGSDQMIRVDSMRSTGSDIPDDPQLPRPVPVPVTETTDSTQPPVEPLSDLR